MPTVSKATIDQVVGGKWHDLPEALANSQRFRRELTGLGYEFLQPVETKEGTWEIVTRTDYVPILQSDLELGPATNSAVAFFHDGQKPSEEDSIDYLFMTTKASPDRIDTDEIRSNALIISSDIIGKSLEAKAVRALLTIGGAIVGGGAGYGLAQLADYSLGPFISTLSQGVGIMTGGFVFGAFFYKNHPSWHTHSSLKKLTNPDAYLYGGDAAREIIAELYLNIHVKVAEAVYTGLPEPGTKNEDGASFLTTVSTLIEGLQLGSLSERLRAIESIEKKGIPLQKLVDAMLPNAKELDEMLLYIT